MHAFREAKVRNFDHETSINPLNIMWQKEYTITTTTFKYEIIMERLISTYILFLFSLSLSPVGPSIWEEIAIKPNNQPTNKPISNYNKIVFFHRTGIWRLNNNASYQLNIFHLRVSMKLTQILHSLAHMQFLAARSLWMTLLLERYSIPLATWMHMSSSLFWTALCSEGIKAI